MRRCTSPIKITNLMEWGTVIKMPEKSKLMADGVAALSGAGAATTLLGQVDQVVSILAGIAAIIAAGVSVYMHCTRRKKNKQKERGSDK